MNEIDPKSYLDPAEEKMEMAVEYLDEALSHIRAGKASPKLLDGIRVSYYGSMAPISNVANISVPDARTIAITPWEKAMFKEIEKAIINSELGITPENNGEVIRICIPPLTEERRKTLVKQSKAEAEQAKVSVRNARRDAIDGLKKAVKKGMPEDIEKDAETTAQKIHDKYLKRIDELFAAKEKEILTV
ncbi:MAG: ribosome recycling factor [Muribaculaceae bacterium]|nr:ribosome recycling factor [Muribaculaceae bacterium]